MKKADTQHIGGDYVGGDKITGDKVGGDKIQGNKTEIITGRDVINSNLSAANSSDNFDLEKFRDLIKQFKEELAQLKLDQNIESTIQTNVDDVQKEVEKEQPNNSTELIINSKLKFVEELIKGSVNIAGSSIQLIGLLNQVSGMAVRNL